MIRGIHFEVENKWGNYFYEIFKNIEIEKYFWVVLQSEIYYQLNNAEFFQKNVYTGKEFYNAIRQKEYYILFANIQAYDSQSFYNSKIDTYDDFLKSECKLIFLCNDVTFIDIYCKEKEVLDKLLKICQFNKFSNLTLLTDENDKRYHF